MQFERFAASSGHLQRLASRAIAGFAVVGFALAAMPASAATLDRIKETGTIKLGYLTDARPFTFRNESGAAEGYAVTLCQQVADQAKKELALPSLTVEWVPVTLENRLREVQEGGIDLLCTPTSVTLTRRQDVAFSIPVFAGGNRAVLRADAPAALRDALAQSRSNSPVWRGSPAATVLKGTSLAVVAGTTSEKWLEGRRAELQVDARIVPVPDYRSGLQQLLDRKVDVLFGDRSLVLGAMSDSQRKDLVVLDRLFTQESAALALARGDEDFRLLVDRSLSQLYGSPKSAEVYKRWFGELDDKTRTFFLWSTPGE